MCPSREQNILKITVALSFENSEAQQQQKCPIVAEMGEAHREMSDEWDENKPVTATATQNADLSMAGGGGGWSDDSAVGIRPTGLVALSQNAKKKGPVSGRGVVKIA